MTDIEFITPEPKAKKVFITPHEAVKMLDKNKHNRTIQGRYVENLARDITNDAWVLNGEAIKIAVNGMILDGQHRLMAIALAGKGIWTFLVTDLPPETQRSMDGGRKRTDGDRYRLESETHPALLSSTLGQIWRWDRGDRRWASNPSPTLAEKDVLLAKNPDIRRSVEVARRTFTEYRAISPTPLAVAHHLLSQIDPEKSPWFFQRLADGADLSTGHPVHTLRKRASNDRETKARVTSARSLAYIIRAWNAYREDRELERLVHAADEAIPDPR